MTARTTRSLLGPALAATLALASGCVGSLSSADGSGAVALCEGTFAARLEGRVVDEAGLAVLGAVVQACVTGVDGSAFCLPPVTSGSFGDFEVEVPERSRCFAEAVVRISRPGDPGRWATTYCEVEGALEGDALALAYDATVLELPAPSSLPPVGDAAASRTVRFSPQLAITLSPDGLVRPDAYPLLRARAVSPGAAPCSIGAPSDVRFDGLVAFGPEVDVDGTVRLELGLAAPEGASVELYTIGGTYTVLGGAQVPEGRFARVATGTVSGGRVVLSGLPILSWAGYRVVPGGTPDPGPAPGPGTGGGGATGELDLPAAGACPASASGVEVGDVVPALEFQVTDGSTFAVREHCEDELVVVYNYVDGCGVCAAFLAAEGNALTAELAARGHRFVVVVARVNDLDGSSRDATVADAERVQRELGLTATVVADEGSELLYTFSRSGPSYLLMLRRGNVIAHPWAGYGSDVAGTVREVMAAIAAE
jgi:hypothetical protein